MKVIPEIHERYIKGTQKDMIVSDVRLFLCKLTFAVVKGVKLKANRVYVSSRSIKHNYDKRPAEEYDFLINHVHKVVKYPDYIYRNKSGKRGDFCFVKIIKNSTCFCSLEVVDTVEGDCELEVVTFFRISKDSYLNSYKLLWSWEGDNPPS